MGTVVKPIKIGFIGCGGHSARHADVIQKMPHNFEVVGALDSNIDVAKKFLAKYGKSGLATISPETLLASPSIEAVLIGSPHKFHLDQARAAVMAGKHVLCEKPLWEGDRDVEARDILGLAADTGLIFSSCHLRRFEKEYVHMRSRLPIYLDAFGRALEFHFQFFYHKPSTKWKMDDSLLLDHMNHEVDLVHFLFGHSSAKFWRLSHGMDEYRVVGKTETGLGIWFSGYRKLESCTFRNELELVFERGRVKGEAVLNSSTGIVSSLVKIQSFEDGSASETIFSPHSYDDALFGVMENFAAAISGEESCYLTSQDLLVNTTICNDLLKNELGSI